MMRKKTKNFINNLITYAIVIVAFIVTELALNKAIPGFTISRSLKGQLIPICVYIVMAVSLNLTVGISGELSLGHAGFMSVGAFSGLIMSGWLLNAFQMQNETLRLVLSMATGGVCAAIAGVLIGIPVLRLRGDYLAIVTLAFGEIIRNVMNCLYFAVNEGKLLVTFNNPDIAGTILYNGPAGSVRVEKIATFEAGFVLVLFTLFVVLNLINSRSGRAIMASSDNRIAAEAMGVNVTKYKLMAFVTSAALAGMAGALYGLNMSSVAPDKFKFDTSIQILVFVVLGGIGNIRGSVIAAALLVVLPEVLREFGDYRMLIYAIVLIAVMLLGNAPVVRQVLDRIHPRKKHHDTVKEGEAA